MPERKTDKIYAKVMDEIPPFSFDEKVAEVFDDMIERSVPGHQELVKISSLIVEHFARPNTLIYDLGCSPGIGTLAIAKATPPGCRIIAVDSSEAMISRLKQTGRSLSTPIEWRLADIKTMSFKPASVVVCNLTLQFLPPESRMAVLKSIHQSLNPAGVLLLTEKIVFNNQKDQQLYDALYRSFKLGNGYSDLEIRQKQQALSEMMRPDSEEIHLKRLHEVGFSSTSVCFRALNFVAFLALP